MKKRRIKQLRGVAQQALFHEANTLPLVPPEVLNEVRAALVELLLDAARPVAREVADEREGV